MIRRLGAIVPALVLATALAAQADQLRVFMTGGAYQFKGPDAVSVWANSPQARVNLDNHANSAFSTVRVTFHNLIAGTYLATPEGVVRGSSREGGTLVSQLTLPPRDKQEWLLHPNHGGPYHFAVLSDTENPENGQRTFGQLAKDMAANRVLFAMHLGNAVSHGNVHQLELFREQLRALPFPTFVLPGSDDLVGEGSTAWPRLFGSLPQTFRIDQDHFFMLDNSRGTLGTRGRAWLSGALQRADDEHARHKFVFLHRPPVDPRPGINEGMGDRREVRYLLGLFQRHHVDAVFGGHIHMYAQEHRRDVTYVTTGGGGHKLDVRPAGGGFYHFMKVDVNGAAVGMSPIQ